MENGFLGFFLTSGQSSNILMVPHDQDLVQSTGVTVDRYSVTETYFFDKDEVYDWTMQKTT